jgi:hypothetical protein
MKKKVIILLLILNLIACSQIETQDYLDGQIDSYLEGSENCQPPCWLGIIPGITKLEEVIEILQRVENSVVDEVEPNKTITFFLPERESYVYIEFNELLVSNINFRVKETCLQEILTKFGNPDFFYFGYGEEGGWGMYIFYPNQGLVFNLLGRDIVTNRYLNNISPELIVWSSYYFPKNSEISTMVKI